jgi:hypothetical protein
MFHHGYVLWIFLLLLAASITLACGSNADSNSQHQILSLAVSPSSADASRVQFTATGTYKTPPEQVTPLQATWAVVGLDGPTSPSMPTVSPNAPPERPALILSGPGS